MTRTSRKLHALPYPVVAGVTELVGLGLLLDLPILPRRFHARILLQTLRGRMEQPMSILATETILIV